MFAIKRVVRIRIDFQTCIRQLRHETFNEMDRSPVIGTTMEDEFRRFCPFLDIRTEMGCRVKWQMSVKGLA